MQTIDVRVNSVKMLREALCIAQAEIGRAPANYARSVSRHIGDLIKELDRHRPLGPDGKHGDRHTPTCGCEDKGGSA